jgi:hypothetical protein
MFSERYKQAIAAAMFGKDSANSDQPKGPGLQWVRRKGKQVIEKSHPSETGGTGETEATPVVADKQSSIVDKLASFLLKARSDAQTAKSKGNAPKVSGDGESDKLAELMIKARDAQNS